uniref:Accessory gland protein Acp76A n=1 Tax=Drosophila rhopaloa TaxID=1041015 RepID=A0A6P4FXK6_DRORH
MVKLQLAFSALCALLLFGKALSENRTSQLFEEIGSHTRENFVLSLFDIELILFEIYAGNAILNDSNLRQDLIIGIGDSEVKKEMQALATKYRKASRAQIKMASRVFVPQEDPLSKEISLIYSLLTERAKKHDYNKDVKNSRTMEKWVSENVDRVLTKYAQDKKATQLVALSGMSVTPQWSIRFKSQHNRYFDRKYGTGHSKGPLCVPMMHTLLKIETMATDEAKGIFIKFVTTDIGILFLLPRKGVSCQDVLDNLSTQINAEMDDPRDINLILPIFKANYEPDISSVIKKINMASVFNGTKFYSEFNIKIDEFVQNTVIDIQPNHNLTKVNDIDMKNIEKFEVNRPFVFVIRDKDSIYAVGRIENLDGLTSQVNCSRKYYDFD